ncbi:hypothetical protein PIROE2DRAFT_15615, partial [Piromyces sp. E2]
ISCVTNNDCPNAFSCKNNYCQYPTYYCLGHDSCIEENKSNDVLYSIQDNTQPEINELNHINTNSYIIIESCHPNNYKCYTRPCFKDSDCFSNNCEVESRRCLINKEFPIYSCINKEKGGMICGKYLEEECTDDNDCLTQQCDTQLHICKKFNKDDITIVDDNSFNNNIKNEKEQMKEKELNDKENVDSAIIFKEVLILIFIIIPVFVLTQYLKSTKYVKNIKRNRKIFEYKKVLVEDLSNC